MKAFFWFILAIQVFALMVISLIYLLQDPASWVKAYLWINCLALGCYLILFCVRKAWGGHR